MIMWISRKGYYELMQLALKNNNDYHTELRNKDRYIDFVQQQARRYYNTNYFRLKRIMELEDENKLLKVEIERIKSDRDEFKNERNEHRREIERLKKELEGVI